MNKLLEFGNKYAKNSDWTDFALTKLCLGSLGVLIGASLSKNKRIPAMLMAGGVFLGTGSILTERVFQQLTESEEAEPEEDISEEALPEEDEALPEEADLLGEEKDGLQE
ncbi:MAG: hypothetical protein HUJ80_03010 [Firmicutes bacterium]|nr:hypothetical protein [Bacillota bacterium]